MKSIVILIVCISVIDCKSDLCQLLNGTHIGIGGVYWEWNLIIPSLLNVFKWRYYEDKYKMYANGKEWWIRLVVDDDNRNAEIGVEDVWDMSPEVILRFCDQYASKWIAFKQLSKLCCEVSKNGNKSKISCNKDDKHYSIDFPLNALDVIAFNGEIGVKTKLDSKAFVILEKKSQKISYLTESNDLKLEANCDYCSVPTFVKQIDPNLTLFGITDYDVSGSRGHLLLFNVKGILKYCITPEGKDLSDRCKRETLNTLSKNCFDSSLPNPESTDISTTFWIIFTILIILLVIAIVIAIYVYFYFRIGKQSTTESTTLSTTATTTAKSKTVGSVTERINQNINKPLVIRKFKSDSDLSVKKKKTSNVI